ncbi:hypothetical protein IW261DRAFT_1517380 [Armillaria novae-zelandiae]|uniref:Secreted protein n=1 Tax=Armillaria novae-zelandiae TaxID=153914 RepID=A0AA39NN81_9AGAR|nr:hypothetical protein IW261DRAFT_1517380 [Armillaria novae-zelandiae]
MAPAAAPVLRRTRSLLPLLCLLSLPCVLCFPCCWSRVVFVWYNRGWHIQMFLSPLMCCDGALAVILDSWLQGRPPPPPLGAFVVVFRSRFGSAFLALGFNVWSKSGQ